MLMRRFRWCFILDFTSAQPNQTQNSETEILELYGHSLTVLAISIIHAVHLAQILKSTI